MKKNVEGKYIIYYKILHLFFSFPAFCNSLVEFVHGELYNEKHEAKKIIKQIMEAEMGYLYTCDENYKNINLEITKIIKENKKAIQGIDPNFIEHLKSKIDIYYTLIVKTLRDSIPKAIGFFLIKESQVFIIYLFLYFLYYLFIFFLFIF